MKQKGFKDYLNDDPSLTEKVTYEEFMRGKTAPKDNEIVSIDDAYSTYCKIMEDAKNANLAN